MSDRGGCLRRARHQDNDESEIVQEEEEQLGEEAEQVCAGDLVLHRRLVCLEHSLLLSLALVYFQQLQRIRT